MSNYNEAWNSEKRTLSLLVETSFYPQAVTDTEAQVAAKWRPFCRKYK
jgi:hypothetical protein